MQTTKQVIFIVISLIFHSLVLAALIFGLEFSNPPPVLRNTTKQDVISAVVLGEIAQSKILPEPVKQIVVKPEPKVPSPPPEALNPKETKTEPDAIALKAEKRKLELQKAAEEKKRRERLAKDLLADITNEKKKKNIQQKKMHTQFEKALKEHAEKSLREDLLNEDIQLKAKHKKETQGEINKYKALIVQSISEHWIVPTSADRKLYCQLMIRVAPTGTVLDVQVIKTSGDKALDRSARAAVLKASPLPVPKDEDAFAAFKEFVLKVRPENILTSQAIIGEDAS